MSVATAPAVAPAKVATVAASKKGRKPKEAAAGAAVLAAFEGVIYSGTYNPETKAIKLEERMSEDDAKIASAMNRKPFFRVEIVQAEVKSVPGKGVQVVTSVIK